MTLGTRARALATVPRVGEARALKELNLSENSFGDEGARALADTLLAESAPALENLFNRIGDTESLALVDVI
jgi:hypothetical protein